jgi:enoyl-CoA hydratase/carnithine racemase
MIDVRCENSVGLIILNRPDKRNALTPEMLDALLEAIAALNPSPRGGQGVGSTHATTHQPKSPLLNIQSPLTPIQAIAMAGEGDVFCSGFDMKLVHADATVLPRLLTGLSHAVRALRRAPVPVILAAHGAAVAGGCALLGGADIVVTHRDAKLGYPVLRIGLSPAVTAPALRQLVHDGGCRERTLDTELISGDEAHRIGLAHICTDIREDAIPRALRIARDLASKPAHAMAQTKHLLNEIDGSLDDATFDRALAASLSVAGSREQLDRVSALWNKP